MPIGLNFSTSKVFPTYISQYDSICYPIAWEQLETHRKYLITYEHISSQTTVVYILAPAAHEANKQGEDHAKILSN